MPTINLGHKKQRDITHNKREYQRVYQSPQWRRLRKYKASINPLCEDCLLEGKVTPQEEIHHIIPFEIGKSEEEINNLAYDIDNLKSLCILHHKIAHKLLNQN